MWNEGLYERSVEEATWTQGREMNERMERRKIYTVRNCIICTQHELLQSLSKWVYRRWICSEFA
jgi:hypothetical protein